jgi:CBS domain-containing protein
MKTKMRLEALTLDPKTAAELMTPNVVTVPTTATIRAAAALLTENNVSAVPVVGPDGQPVGVISRSDIVAHDYAEYEYLQPGLYDSEQDETVLRMQKASESEPYFEKGRTARVCDVMTPVLFSVAPTVPATMVVDAMLSLGVHRLFVTDLAGSVTGVISATDVLRHLRESLSCA